MRALVVACFVALLAAPAFAQSAKPAVWNSKLKTDRGGSTQLTVLGTNPDELFPTCRCVAGIWQLARDGESATHFAGSLDAVSFNYKPGGAQKPLAVKLRKTRALMGAARKYRAGLHAIVRGKGQLVVREVKGGEYEVVGFAPDVIGDLFASRPRWHADFDRPPKPAAPAPIIDSAADAVALAKLINDYRASLKLPRVAISPALTKVAQAHVRDLNENKPVTESCNMHSWSSAGNWKACCYDKSDAAARCMWSKPKEIAGYRGSGYEIAANASGIEPEKALAQWQGSQAHHHVMINQGIWKKPWRAMGVAIEGDYAVAWFGEERD
jgi:hypothetical protein